jgi:hypothetical protein
MCEEDKPADKAEAVRGTVVCEACAAKIRMPPNWPPTDSDDARKDEGQRCGWCGELLTPDDGGFDHESCVLARPGVLICVMCSKPVREAEAVEAADGRFPIHRICASVTDELK